MDTNKHESEKKAELTTDYTDGTDKEKSMESRKIRLPTKHANSRE